MMDDVNIWQVLFNIVFSILLALLGFLLASLRQAIRDLHEEDKNLAKEISETRVGYISAERFESVMSEFSQRLRSMDGKLDDKATYEQVKDLVNAGKGAEL